MKGTYPLVGLDPGQKSTKQLVSVQGSPVWVPTGTVSQFCHQYCLGEKIKTALEKEGFETAGALTEVSDTALLDVGLQNGHIAEIKRALKEFLYNHGEADTAPE
ncbi:hypothetical protein DFH07DRAFT_777116 [Mycena maculata]|uniref:SAM domain-containing protein n=1 Tax=Mycena maculata TaxID=230809 RepID=A0AAD7N3R7_9AGAR|nr:hypothetical protein DFH07DRAFT_777116 [Mycena maculata]